MRTTNETIIGILVIAFLVLGIIWFAKQVF